MGKLGIFVILTYPNNHILKSTEVYYILEGEGMMHIDDETSMVYPGQSVFIPANSRQFIENRGEGDLVFLCIVNPAWRSEDEEVFAPAGCDLRGKWPNN